MLGLGPPVMLALTMVGIATGAAYYFARIVQKARGLVRPPRWLIAIGPVLGMIAALVAYPYVIPRYREGYVTIHADALMARFEGKLTLYRAMRQYEPALYQEVRTAVLDGLKRNLSREQMIAAARAPITRAIPRMLGQAPDEPVL